MNESATPEPQDKLLDTWWTLSEERFLREHYGKTPLKRVAERLGRSYASVRQKAHRLGLNYSPLKRQQYKHVDVIKQMIYDGHSAREISEAIGVQRQTVYLKVREGGQYDEMDYQVLKSNSRKARWRKYYAEKAKG